jgi:hypothetical protein
VPDDLTHTLVDQWRAWVTELRDHPLDANEYAAMLESRDDLAERLAVTGESRAADETEDIDVEFKEITVEMEHDRFASIRGSGWWWGRLPSDEEAREYFFGRY